MSFLKKIFIIQLLSALIFSQVGYYFFYTIKQFQIKEAVKHQLLCALPESYLQVIAADNKKIVWEEDEKEFSIDGKMYDVAKIKTINDIKYLYCLSDEQETILIKDLANTIQNKTGSKQQKEHKQTIKFQTIACQQIESILESCAFKISRAIFPIFKQNIMTAVVSVVVPPPKA
jgi:hypothetical protein